MNSVLSQLLLSADDPPPVRITNPLGMSRFLLIGDHAGNRVPARLQSLGIGKSDTTRHIAWDIGIAAVGEALSNALDAVFIHQAYSRLVIDCNRDAGAPDAIPPVSDGTAIPGNQLLSPIDRATRVAEIHAPYHAAIAAEVARRDAAGRDTILVSLHSFTPAMNGRARPWQIGVLHAGGQARFARAVLQILEARSDLCVGDNEPYAMDGIDYTIPRHAFPSGRSYVEIEIRQDLLVEPEQHRWWTDLLATVFCAAASSG